MASTKVLQCTDDESLLWAHLEEEFLVLFLVLCFCTFDDYKVCIVAENAAILPLHDGCGEVYKRLHFQAVWCEQSNSFAFFSPKYCINGASEVQEIQSYTRCIVYLFVLSLCYLLSLLNLYFLYSILFSIFCIYILSILNWVWWCQKISRWPDEFKKLEGGWYFFPALHSKLYNEVRKMWYITDLSEIVTWPAVKAYSAISDGHPLASST